MDAATPVYNLVHLTTGGEYKNALVASQLFDQAEFQAVIKDGYAPQKVSAWVIGPMREYFDRAAKDKINSLRARCPHIDIRMMNGIGRLGNFPTFPLLCASRRKLGKRTPVIYHCRGESAAVWGLQLSNKFAGDKVVLDVRGYWPAELLYNKGIENPAQATGTDKAAYDRAKATLRNIINKADAVTTVSEALKKLLITETGAPTDTAVVPCCVSKITGDDKRQEIRDSWGIKDDELALVYSGTTAAYQHLEDLTVPFLKKINELNSKIRPVFLSSEPEKIKKILMAAGMNMNAVILKSFPQQEVAAALTACDAGILIRKPTLVNRVANPVKIAEYLASGLPIIIEQGVGGVADEMFSKSLLKGIAVTNGDIDAAVKDVNDWLSIGMTGKREQVRAYVKEVYLWQAAVQVSREMYKKVLVK